MEARADFRGRFGHLETESVGDVVGQCVKAAQLSVRAFNFGQHWRTPGVLDVRYRVGLPLAFVAHLMSRELPEYVEDWIKYPDTFPLEIGLRNRQWPDVAQILDDPELCLLALKWFAHDCLLEWLGDGEPKEAPGYVINTVEFAERHGDTIRFEGCARAAGQPVKYQDV